MVLEGLGMKIFLQASKIHKEFWKGMLGPLQVGYKWTFCLALQYLYCL